MKVQIKRNLAYAACMLILIILSGCETVHYYSQAIYGQCSILLKRRPISEIIADPESSAFLRERLSFILAVRQFAASELHLPVKDNYLTYVELRRPYVVWNVFGAPEFSLTLETWCYPVVGCTSYRGYFSEKNAQQYAARLKDRGNDVYVAGVTAYSTLGWFDDPVLSTFIHYSEAQSAGLIFHELAHQLLYIKDDTVFNESFATAVEQEGLRRWQQAGESSQIYRDYLTGYRRRQQFVQLIMEYRQALEILYESDAATAVKREKKAAIFSELRDEFKRMNTNEMDLSVYAGWIHQDLNNAKIGSVAEYYTFVPAFQTLLARSDGDLSQFYKVCRQLGQKNKDERDRLLNAYLNE
jgi:predicted aminopeptidase